MVRACCSAPGELDRLSISTCSLRTVQERLNGWRRVKTVNPHPLCRRWTTCSCLIERSPNSNASHTAVLPLGGQRIPKAVITGPSQWYVGARISPDGHWVAYVSNEEGRFEIYVRSYPSFQNKAKISAEGGKEVVWAQTAGNFSWRNGDKMMVAAFQAKNGVSAGTPRILFDLSGYVSGLQAMAQVRCRTRWSICDGSGRQPATAASATERGAQLD